MVLLAQADWPSRGPFCYATMTRRVLRYHIMEMGPCLTRVGFLVCVEWQKFDFFFLFYFSPHRSDIPLLKEAWGLLYVSRLLALGFLPSPLPAFRTEALCAAFPILASCALDTSKQRRPQLKIQRMSPGCLLDAPVGLVQRWLPHSICIRDSRNVVDLSSPLLFPSQMFDSSLWRAALFLVPFSFSQPACCSLAASLALLLSREQGLNPFALWVQAVYIYIYMLYRLFFQHPLYNRAGQTASRGLTLALRGIPGKGQLVISRSASNEIGCEAA